jgi:hypothetical protein
MFLSGGHSWKFVILLCEINELDDELKEGKEGRNAIGGLSFEGDNLNTQ